jgi:hypothetical protein
MKGGREAIRRSKEGRRDRTSERKEGRRDIIAAVGSRVIIRGAAHTNEKEREG